MSIELSIKYKQQQIVVTANQEKTIRWIKEQIKEKVRIPIIQQQLSYKDGDKKHVLTDNEMPINVANIPNQLIVKNLGKQIRWEMVFYVEYFGPILIMPLFYILGKRQSYTDVQIVALVMGILHFVKRQYETAYVHVFSRESMPFKRVAINCLHYWGLFALLNSIQLYLFPSGHTYSKQVIGSIAAAWTVFQLLNFKCHKILGDFRKAPKEKNDQQYDNPTKARKIPYGYGFDSVSCANYFWQALGWIAFSLLTRNYTAYLFTIASIVQMAQWAKDKHKRYLKEFGDRYPKNRKAMFPFIF